MAQLRQPIRAILAVSDLLIRWRVIPDPARQLEKPAATRQLVKPPFWMTRPGDRSLLVNEEVIAGRGGPVRLRLYRKPGTSPGGPAILYLHGGGFTLGGLDACDYITRELCSRSGFPVVSVEYRIAPDCPFPGPLEDCRDALQWMVDTRPFGIDSTRIAVVGDSAGGNLSAALSLLVRDDGGQQVAHQTLVYPFTDGTLSSPDWDTHAMAGIDRSAGQRMVQAYAPNHPVTEPLVSVLHADHHGLPPALVITAEHDVLRSDGRRYAEKLRAAGVPVVHRDFEGVPHAFLGMPRLTRESDVAMDLIVREISGAVTPAERHTAL